MSRPPSSPLVLLFLCLTALIARRQSLVLGEIVRRNWLPNQINQTLCWWDLPRAALLRDTFYLDGGYLGLRPGFANGTYGAPSRPENGQPLYMINFTQPFNTSQNASSILRRLDKTAGAANNIAPEFLDGAIFSNNYELYLYGGLLRDSNSLQPPPGNEVLGYERFQYGPRREAWQPGFIRGQLPENVTRYITAGASVSVPSENLGFYFAGMRRADWGEIRTAGRDRFNVTAAANTLISVDMTTMRQEEWANSTLPSTVPGRAGAELVWVPTAQQGALVAIGGVVNPEWAYTIPPPSLLKESEETSPRFMSTVAVYDIRARKWYNQETSGDRPPQLTQFCAVVASAKDGSSHNIYIYGGYRGLSPTQAPSDEVYVLSVPSFTWIKVSPGSAKHGRRGHRCTKLYPDQMLVVGGLPEQRDTYECVAGMIQVFNLNTLSWQNTYDPKVWSEYRVPSVIAAKIGGSSDGGATTTKPSTWSDAALGDIFGAKYAKAVTTYYPYESIAASPTDSPQPTRLPTLLPTPAASRSSGTPSWIAPVLGVVLGLMAFVAIIGGFLLWRRRRRRQRRRSSSKGTSSRSDASTSGFNRHRILSWMQATPPARAPTVTSAGGPSSVSGTTALASSGELSPKQEHVFVQEAEATEIHELPATSMASELPAMQHIGFSPSLAVHHHQQHHHRTRPGMHVSHPSDTSSVGAGVVTGAAGTAAAGAATAADMPRPESPTADFMPGHRRQVSSLGSSGLPSPASVHTLAGSGVDDGVGDGDEHGGPAMDDADLVSPTSQPGAAAGNGASPVASNSASAGAGAGAGGGSMAHMSSADSLRRQT